MTLTFIGRGSTWDVSLTDLRATVCTGGRHVISGEATLDGASIHVVGAATCVGRTVSQPVDGTWTYDRDSDTIQAPLDPSATPVIVLTWTRGATGLDAFDGTWTAIDSQIDGSHLTLTFSGSGTTRQVSFSDDVTRYCAAQVAWSAVGPGTIGTVAGDGRFISVAFHGSCAGGVSPRDYVEKYEYQWASSSLLGPLAPLEIGAEPLPYTVTWARP